MPTCHCICGIPSPTTLGPNIPCTLSQATTIGGGLLSSMMGVQQQRLPLARGSADSVCLRVHRCLHHAPPRPHPASHPHNTLACNHSSLPPPSVLPPPHTHTFQHIIFCKYIGPRLCVRFFVKGACTQIDLLACRVCLVKNMMISTQVTIPILTCQHDVSVLLKRTAGKQQWGVSLMVLYQ